MYTLLAIDYQHRRVQLKVMTECIYFQPLETFDEIVLTLPIMSDIQPSSRSVQLTKFIVFAIKTEYTKVLQICQFKYIALFI